MVESSPVQVPGRYILVDHALSRLGAHSAGFLMVEGDANNEISMRPRCPPPALGPVQSVRVIMTPTGAVRCPWTRFYSVD